MFSTPPRTIVKTRGALKRETLTQMKSDNEVHSVKTCPAVMDNAEDNEREPIIIMKSAPAEGSLKIEPGGIKAASSKKSSRSSITARRKQLELEAAEAKARIEKDLIDKRLAADLAALDDECSQKSRGSAQLSLAGTSQKVEQWLEKSIHETHESCTNAVCAQPAAAGSAPHDLQHLAQAIQNLATTSQSANTKYLSRLATPKDLPTFSGEPFEWLQFKKVYEESTKLCDYSDSENITRLNKCLRGDAREAVSSLLISDNSPTIILEALELRFGRPELIIYKITAQFKKLQPLPQNYHNELVNFAVKITNYVAVAKSINQSDYLRSPELLNIVISKCPNILINKWADYIYENRDDSKAKLQLFSEFLHREAIKVAAAGISHIHIQTENKFPKKNDDRKSYSVQSVLNNDSDENTKCKFCKASVHTLSNCVKFKRALRKDKWRFVKIHKLCHKCLLLGHGKETCPGALCDVDDCGMAHHRLLHWPAKASPQSTNDATTSTATASELKSTTETITNTTVTPSTSVMLKIVRVNVHGPSGVIATHALLDDGATVSLLSADLANCINLQGQPETLRIRGAWNSDIVCQSEMVNFKLSNSDGKMYEVRARKINELDLPTQNLSTVKLESYEHLRDLKDSLSCANVNVKPKILIGQDNFHLLMTLKTIYRGVNEPCATLTPLGWCLHGIVPAPTYARKGRPLTAEHTLTTTMYARAAPAAAVTCAAPTPLSPAAPASARPAHTQQETHTCAGAEPCSMQLWPSDAHIDEDGQLHELVRRSFAIEAIGVNSQPRVNKDEVRAVDIIDKSAVLNN